MSPVESSLHETRNNKDEDTTKRREYEPAVAEVGERDDHVAKLTQRSCKGCLLNMERL